MKLSMFKFLSLLMMLGLFITSCGDDEEMEPMTEEAGMTCKVDGTDWAAVAPQAQILQGKLAVSGVSAGDMSVTLTLDDNETGTYALGPNEQSAIAFLETTDGSTFAFASNQNGVNMNYGEVVISKVDTTNKVVSGTFVTEVHRQADNMVKIITEGAFTDVTYTETVAPTTSTLSAEVNGVEFEAVSVSGFIAFGSLSISATDSDASESIGFSLPEDIAAGTYELGTAGFSDYGAQYNLDASTFLGADSGTLVVTEHDLTAKVIKATFSFEASELLGSNTASVKDGTFEVSY